MIQPLLIALQFLTRLPVRLRSEPDADAIGRSLLYYPLVGLLIGVLLAASAWLLGDVPVFLRAALLLVVWVVVTGALHLDGLADTVDGWAGGRGDRERTLTLMKDPRCGAMGVVAIGLVLLVKFGALLTACEAVTAPSVAHGPRLDPIGDTAAVLPLVLAPLLGRLVLPLLFLATPYVRPGGIGAVLAAHMPRNTAPPVLIVSVIVILATGATGLWMLLAGLGVFWATRRAMLRRIGGTTGDTAGALVELTEASVLVVGIIVP